MYGLLLKEMVENCWIFKFYVCNLKIEIHVYECWSLSFVRIEGKLCVYIMKGKSRELTWMNLLSPHLQFSTVVYCIEALSDLKEYLRIVCSLFLLHLLYLDREGKNRTTNEHIMKAPQMSLKRKSKSWAFSSWSY